MSKSVVITQSNYLPWKGYFDNIALADEFVIYDSAQYTKGDWRNRNRFKTVNGLVWLTVPVTIDGLYSQSIDETRIANDRWSRKHWQTIKQAYGQLPGFQFVEELYGELFCDGHFSLLSELNRCMIEKTIEFLGIRTSIHSDREFDLNAGRSQRLLNICRELNAGTYLSGPAAKAYLDEKLFKDAGIEVRYFDNSYASEYKQPFPPFTHEVSIIDLIACCGKSSGKYMKHINKQNTGTTGE